MPEEKTHRGGDVGLSKDALEVQNRVDLSKGQQNRYRTTDQFEQEFRKRGIYKQAEDYILRRTSQVPSIPEQETTILT